MFKYIKKFIYNCQKRAAIYDSIGLREDKLIELQKKKIEYLNLSTQAIRDGSQWGSSKFYKRAELINEKINEVKKEIKYLEAKRSAIKLF